MSKLFNATPNLRELSQERERIMKTLLEITRSAYAWFKVESDQGVTAIEYGILAALIAVVIITAVTLVGTNLTGVFNSVAAKVHS